jgi:predicted outer membrane repeat protein
MGYLKIIMFYSLIFVFTGFLSVSFLYCGVYSLEDAVHNSSNNDVIFLNSQLVEVNDVIVINHNLTIIGMGGLTCLDVKGGCFVVDPNCTFNLSNVCVSNRSLSSPLINNKGKLYLGNCLFEDNKGNFNGLIINNLCNSSFMINNCSFINNDAGDTSKGGVINMNYSVGVNNISNSIFKNNHGYLGGCGYIELYDNSFLNVCDCMFENNKGYKGGVFYNKDSSLYLKDSEFTGNNVDGKGGVVYNDNSDNLRILDCDFNDNSASYMGGAVYATTAVNSVGHSNFINNHARSGGAIYNKDGGKQTYVYNRTVFNGNGCDDAGSYGGAITINNGGLVLTRSTLNNNSAESGGAVYSDLGECSFSDCSFNDNHLRTENGWSCGGGIYSKNSRLSINGTVFNRSAATTGGAVYSDGGSSIYCGDGTIFMNNSAGVDGGAIYSSMSDLLVEKTGFEFNRAQSNGGAIKAVGLVGNGGPSIKILSSNFIDNVATYGAGLFLYDGSYALVNDCVFTNNNFYNIRSSHVLINNTCFNRCIDSIYHESGNDLTLRNVSINSRNATIDMIVCPNSYYHKEIHIE